MRTNQLPQFDYRLPSLRLLPIDFPEFNSIDAIDSQNVLRWGLRNRIQTKRDGVIEDLLNWEVLTDWRLHPESGQTTFSDIFSELRFKPRRWLLLESETRFDIDREEFRLAYHTVTFQPNDTWHWRLGHFYARSESLAGPDSLGLGNNLITSSLYYRLNENWAVRLSQHFEARDGRMEEQYYTLYRDLRSWTAALTFRLRDNRVGSDDFTVAVTFSLKAFPRYGRSRETATPYGLFGG